MFMDKCVVICTGELWEIPVIALQSSILSITNLNRAKVQADSVQDLCTKVVNNSKNLNGKFNKLIVFGHGLYLDEAGKDPNDCKKLGIYIGKERIVQDKADVPNLAANHEVKDMSDVAGEFSKLSNALSDDAVVVMAHCWLGSLRALHKSLAKAIDRPVIAGTGQSSIFGGNNGSVIQISPNGSLLCLSKMTF